MSPATRPRLHGYDVTEVIDGRPGAAARPVRRLQYVTMRRFKGSMTRQARIICDDTTAKGDRIVTAFEVIRAAFGYYEAMLYIRTHVDPR